MMYSCAPAGSEGQRPAARSRLARKSGRSLRVDIHCHYLNPDVEAAVRHLNPMDKEPTIRFANALTREVNRKLMQDRAAKLSTIAVRLKDMDRMGIDVQAVSPAPFQYYYWTEPDFGAGLARRINDRIAEIVGQWPDRFAGLGTLPLQNAELAVGELERCVKRLGFRGIEIGTNVDGVDLADPRLGLDRLFAKAQELDILIFMHPLGFNQGQRLMDHYFNNVIGNPLESTIAVSHLIFGGVLDRYPKLKLCVAHAGGYLPFYHGRMDHAHRARPDCRTMIKKPPSSYLRKLHFDTITFDPGMLRRLIDVYGAEHVLLGTDYPYDMGEDDPVGLIESVPKLDRAGKTLVMGGNAARLLKLKRR